jgi:CYTH domain-containing protein
MKTAMQELIDKIQYSIDVQSGVSLTETQVNTLKAVMLIAETSLEKEKEQIMDSYLQGSFDDGPNITNSEQYYNQTYNQTNVGNDGFEFDNSSTIPPPKTNK